jgi:hypothetical protein
LKFAQGKEAFKRGAAANQTVKQRLEISKDGNSYDTFKKAKRKNARWKATMTPWR